MKLFENLRMLPHAPGVQMQPIPEDAVKTLSELDEVKDELRRPDERISIRASDKALDHPGEYYDGEEEGQDRRNEQSFKRPQLSPSTVDTEQAAKKSKINSSPSPFAEVLSEQVAHHSNGTAEAVTTSSL